MTEFKDYPENKIAEKLKQVEKFEMLYGTNTTTKAWRKWCTDYNYREREWKFRQATANNMNFKTDYR
tara:strand:- start:173 stop:373 length:201 start_codon:yes stop_codon:yes gene_type:complete